jgi:hypothetical protein
MKVQWQVMPNKILRTFALMDALAMASGFTFGHVDATVIGVPTYTPGVVLGR